MNRLTENFTLNELTTTSTGLYNVPEAREKRHLLFLAGFILQPIRDRWGSIKVTSGYRSMAVNNAVGSNDSSQHRDGEAADIIPMESNLIDVFRWFVEESRIPYGQAILEKGTWIHVSLPRLNQPNNEALVYDGENYSKWRGKI